MKTLNGNVAVEPIEFEHNKGKSEQIATRFSGTDRTMRTLVKTKILFDSEQFKAGQYIYVKAEDASRSQFVKNKMLYKTEAGDIEFILVPVSMVVAVDG